MAAHIEGIKPESTAFAQLEQDERPLVAVGAPFLVSLILSGLDVKGGNLLHS